MTRLSLVLLAALWLLAPVPNATAAPAAMLPDPYQIFARARQFWDAQRYPARIDYTTVITVNDNGAEKAERYASAYDTRTNSAWSEAVSDYEDAHPAKVPGGFSVRIQGGGGKPGPDPATDFIGVPMLAPNYSFTLRDGTPKIEHSPTPTELVAQIRAQFHDPTRHAQPAPSPSGLRTIAVVVADNRKYTIVLDGSATIEGRPCYHLSLTPVHADGRYRLRQLWIDEMTYATLRAQIALNFVDGPGTTIPWTINFGAVNGAPYIVNETANAPYRYARHTYGLVTVAFDDIRERDSDMPLVLAPLYAYLILTEPPESAPGT